MRGLTIKTLFSALSVFVMITIATPVARAAERGDEWLPALFLTVVGEDSARTTGALVEAVSECMLRGSLGAFAETQYGGRFGAASKRGMVGLTTVSARISDECLAEQMKGSLGTSLRQLANGERVHWIVSFRWIQPGTDEIGYQEVRAMSFAERALMMWRLVVGAGSPTALAQLERIRMYTMNVPKGPAVLPVAMPIRAYRWLAEGTQTQALPISYDINFVGDNQGLQIDWDGNFKPAMMSDVVNMDRSGLFIESFSWHPAFFATDPPVMKIVMDRYLAVPSYGIVNLKEKRGLNFEVRFGVTVGGSFQQCVGEACAQEAFRLPTIVGRPTGIASVVAAVGSPAKKLMGGDTRVYQMFRTMRIDVRDPDSLTILKDGSSLPIVINDRTPYGQKRWLLADEQTTFLGIRLYERLLGDAVTGGLTPELRKRVSDIDQSTAEAVGEAAAAILW